MDELQVSTSWVVDSRDVDDRAPDRLVDAPREVKRQMGVVQALGPGVLIADPHHRPALAKHASNAIVLDRLAIREVVQNEPHGPFARRIGPRQVILAEVEVFQRFVACRFQTVE
jgi:hypothetical protein